MLSLLKKLIITVTMLNIIDLKNKLPDISPQNNHEKVL